VRLELLVKVTQVVMVVDTQTVLVQAVLVAVVELVELEHLRLELALVMEEREIRLIHL